MTEEIQITIIGAGVIGCAVAMEISKISDGDIVVVEKNNQIAGENQSSRNSGVIHAGIYYPRDFGPIKSRLCVDGNGLIYEFCIKHNIPFKKTGKIVVATSELEEEYIGDVLRIARENNVPGVKRINRDEIKKIEPNVEGLCALYVPTSGIIEPTAYIKKLHSLAEENGVIFLTGNEVTGIETNPGKDNRFLIRVKSSTSSEEFKSRILINCAGLFSDKVAKMIDSKSFYEIDPIKGESAKFYCSKRPDIAVKGTNIYPVPFGYYPDGERANVPFNEFMKLFKNNEVTKSVGVHLTPELDISNGRFETGNTITIGPAYSKPKDKEDYTNSRGAEYFYKMAKPFFPNIRAEDISLHQTGIRAKLKNHYDYIIEKNKSYPYAINLIGIDSPGLTSSLAIADYVKNIVTAML
ncbi:MAG: NAD(P)/FAD-dependent oxidoreductase [Actinobacteria bacterium]|nr:NAD(P)/FAD-dependent oxidoreductase [Actinomycetota bacterium]